MSVWGPLDLSWTCSCTCGQPLGGYAALLILAGFAQVSGGLVGYWLGKKNFPVGSYSKASAYNAGDPGSIPGLGSSGEGNGNPLQYSCLENPMDVGAW